MSVQVLPLIFTLQRLDADQEAAASAHVAQSTNATTINDEEPVMMNHNTINSVIQLNKNMETENKGCTHTSQVHEHIDGDGVGCSSCDELGMLYIFTCTIKINFSQ
jgi:hypothetical protein